MMSLNNLYGQIIDAITWFDGRTLSEQCLMVIAIASVLIYFRLGRIMRIMKTGQDLTDRFKRYGSRTNLGGVGYARAATRTRTTMFDNGSVPTNRPHGPQHPMTVSDAQLAQATGGRETSMAPYLSKLSGRDHLIVDDVRKEGDIF